MKKILVVAALLTMAAGTVHARPDRGHGPPQDGNPAEHLTRELGLDEAQAVEVGTIFENARARHDEQRDQSQESFCAIRADADAQIMDLLNDEQKEQFEALQARRADRSNQHGEHRKKGNRDNRQGRGPGANTRNMDARRQGPPDCSD